MVTGIRATPWSWSRKQKRAEPKDRQEGLKSPQGR